MTDGELGITTVGPLSFDTRDKLREFKDDRDLNYNQAILTLLDEVEYDD